MGPVRLRSVYVVSGAVTVRYERVRWSVHPEHLQHPGAGVTLCGLVVPLDEAGQRCLVALPGRCAACWELARRAAV
jgi:hypothetical protein